MVEDFAGEYLKSGELFTLKFEHEIPKRQFCIVTDVPDAHVGGCGEAAAIFKGCGKI